jgi:hypothetical protein
VCDTAAADRRTSGVCGRCASALFSNNSGRGGLPARQGVRVAPLRQRLAAPPQRRRRVCTCARAHVQAARACAQLRPAGMILRFAAWPMKHMTARRRGTSSPRVSQNQDSVQHGAAPQRSASRKLRACSPLSRGTHAGAPPPPLACAAWARTGGSQEAGVDACDEEYVFRGCAAADGVLRVALPRLAQKPGKGRGCGAREPKGVQRAGDAARAGGVGVRVVARERQHAAVCARKVRVATNAVGMRPQRKRTPATRLYSVDTAAPSMSRMMMAKMLIIEQKVAPEEESTGGDAPRRENGD